VRDAGEGFEAASTEFKFAAAVAEFGLLLRDSTHKGQASFEQVRELALAGLGADAAGYRRGFVEPIDRARSIE